MEPDEDAAPISLSVFLLTGSRSWLRALRRPRWKPKVLTITPAATVYHSHPLHTTSTDAASSPSFTLLPGGAAHASPLQLVSYNRPHVFILHVVPASAAEIRPRPHRLVFHVGAPPDAARAVSYAVDVSFRRMGGLFAPYVAPLLTAWGHRRRVPLFAALDAANTLGAPFTPTKFAEHFQSAVACRVAKHVSSEEFIAVMVHLATDMLRQVLPVADDAASLAPSQLAEVAECPLSDAEAWLDVLGVQKCSPALLLYVLFRPHNSVIDPKLADVAHDMSQPLNQYLICSSHNTYLSGNQLRSKSSAYMYRMALERGCRCVEVDLWDGDDGRPIVKHGHTLTSEDTFENVLHVLAQNAFSHGTDLPLIISIENHLDPEQQITAAQLIASILADRVYAPQGHSRDPEQLPSPDVLRGRILIKAKTGHPILRDEHPDIQQTPFLQPDEIGEDDDTDSEQEPEADLKNRRLSYAIARNPKKSARRKKRKGQLPPVSTVVPELAALVFLAGGNRKAVLALWERGISGTEDFITASCVSLNEKRLMSVYKNVDHNVIREFNATSLTRVYPKGSRVDSSNFTPTMAHFLGCQLVAMNYQKQDSALAVNEARFLCNQGSGYVLASTLRESQGGCILQLSILSALLLPPGKEGLRKEVGDPYCVVKLYDGIFDEDEDDLSSFKFETEHARNNTFCPVWKQSVNIPVARKSLAVLSLKVYDYDRASGDELLGYCAVPLSLVREGVRSFPLKSKYGETLNLPGTELQPAVLCRVAWG